MLHPMPTETRSVQKRKHTHSCLYAKERLNQQNWGIDCVRKDKEEEKKASGTSSREKAI